MGEAPPLEEALRRYGTALERHHHAMVAAKLGLDLRPTENTVLFDALVSVLQLTETDMTLFFRGLADVPSEEPASVDDLLAPVLASMRRRAPVRPGEHWCGSGGVLA